MRKHHATRARGSAVLCGVALAVSLFAYAETPDATDETRPATPAVDQAAVQRLYRSSCRACHASGAAGAHRSGDAAAWAAVMDKGMPTLTQSVRQGLGAMPAGGLCPQCSDAEIRALIRMMSAAP